MTSDGETPSGGLAVAGHRSESGAWLARRRLAGARPQRCCPRAGLVVELFGAVRQPQSAEGSALLRRDKPGPVRIGGPVEQGAAACCEVEHGGVEAHEDAVFELSLIHISEPTRPY